jgi:hypothetical protein
MGVVEHDAPAEKVGRSAHRRIDAHEQRVHGEVVAE